MVDILEESKRHNEIKGIFSTFRSPAKADYIEAIISQTEKIPIKSFVTACRSIRNQTDFPKNLQAALWAIYKSEIVESSDHEPKSCGKCLDGHIQVYFPSKPIYRFLRACTCPMGQESMKYFKDKGRRGCSDWAKGMERGGEQVIVDPMWAMTAALIGKAEALPF